MNYLHTGKVFTLFISIIIISFLSLRLTAGDEQLSKKYNSQLSEYPILDSFQEVAEARDVKYIEPVRVSPQGPYYHGFWFYNCSHYELYQFDPTARYMLGLRTFIEGRKVQPTDRGEVGIIDLKNNNEWTRIGETSAFNWQQGTRLQWVPGSFEEIVWNDRDYNGKLVSRVYNIKTKKIRTLPVPVYTISPDGKTALSINFERIKHGGCKYVGVEDPFDNQWAPEKIGVIKMDMQTGKTELIVSVKDMAKKMFPEGFPSDTTGGHLYFFRTGFNPSGNRFILFVKDSRQTYAEQFTRTTEGFSMNLEGEDIRYFYNQPSHHFWLNDSVIVDNGNHGPNRERGYYRFTDDGTGEAKEKYFNAPNGHITFHKNGEWILTDTYVMKGFIFLYMYHIPTKKFVPLAKLPFKMGGYFFPAPLSFLRVDLHPQFSPDGNSIRIDSTHEGDGRQMYLIDVSHIINNPPLL